MSSFFQKIGLSKTHKYESTLPLKLFSVEQILSIDPKDIGLNIREKEGSIRLNDEQSRALAFLLLLKEEEQKEPSKKGEHDRRVQMYLQRESEVSGLIKNTQKEVEKENNYQTRLHALYPNYSDLEERHRKLNEPIAPKVQDKSQKLDEDEYEELENYFNEKGGRRKSKRRKRSKKSKKNKTKHIKHSKSKKNKSTKTFQKRKTRVTRNK